MRRSLSLVLALLAGCGGATSLRLDVSEAPGLPPPSELRLSLYAHGPAGGPWYLPLDGAQKSLPGSLVVGPLDSSLPDFRVQLDGLDAARAVTSQAAARIALTAGQQARSALVLAAPLDSDGDGVADAIDDCPQQADPLQDCAAPDGGLDLGIPDLPPSMDLSGVDLAAPPCPAGALFCDDFESGDASRWPTVDQGKYDTTITVDKTMPWRGSYAAHATGGVNLLDGGNPSDFATLDHRIGTFGGKQIWARAYVYVSRPANYLMVLWLGSGTLGQAVGIDNTGNWVVTQDSSAQADLTTSVPAATGRWVCLELGVIDTGNPRVELYVDSQAVPLTNPGNVTLSAFPPGHLAVGLVRTPGNLAVQAFVDDVALATSRVGCE